MNRLWEGASAPELALDVVCAAGVALAGWAALVVAFCF